MNKNSNLPFPRALGLPLRDILRGLASFADATEEMLEPAAAALPGPVRDTFHAAMKTIEGTGARLLSPRIDHDDIRRASAFLRGVTHGPRDAECCASVLAFAWERMRETGPDFHHILSETVAASRLATMDAQDGLSGSAQAAAILLDLRRYHVAGKLPGLPVTPTDAEVEAIDLKLFTFMIWLLAVRAETFDEELQLLEMATALTQAFRRDVLDSIDSPSDLARQIQNLSEHL